MPANFELSAQCKEILRAYDVSYNFTFHMPDAPKDMTEEQERKYKPKAGRVICHIIDRSTKEAYIHQEGDDQSTACHAALLLVPKTPKPKTRAQLMIEQNQTAASDGSALEAANAEIAALRAQLAQQSGAVSVVAPKNKGGRPRKNPLPTDSTPATAGAA